MAFISKWTRNHEIILKWVPMIFSTILIIHVYIILETKKRKEKKKILYFMFNMNVLYA